MKKHPHNRLYKNDNQMWSRCAASHPWKHKAASPTLVGRRCGHSGLSHTAVKCTLKSQTVGYGLYGTHMRHTRAHKREKLTKHYKVQKRSSPWIRQEENLYCQTIVQGAGRKIITPHLVLVNWMPMYCSTPLNAQWTHAHRVLDFCLRKHPH